MADVLISGLPTAGPLAAGDRYEVEQGTPPSSSSGQSTLGDLRAWVKKRPVVALSIVGGVVTIDLAVAAYSDFTLALTANASLAFNNLPGAGFSAEYELLITQDPTGSRTFALPASHKPLGGSDIAIASAANAVTMLSAKTFNNGTTWRYAMQESA